jgi:hypothetical protein
MANRPKVIVRLVYQVVNPVGILMSLAGSSVKIPLIPSAGHMCSHDLRVIHARASKRKHEFGDGIAL